MVFIYSLANKIGSSVCHQIPSRTLVIGGIYLPLCGRTTGIYLGFLISAIILFFLFSKENELAPLYVLIIFFLLIASTAIDWVLSHLGIYESSNNIRFITGFLAGSSITAIIFPVFNRQYYQRSDDLKIFKSPIKLIAYLLMLIFFIILTLLRLGFLSLFYYYLSAFSVIFTFYFVNLLMIILIPMFANKARRVISRYLILPSVISLALTSLELFVFFKLNVFFSN
ncbi:MAG: DUF2085 domain-containing protein, partial [Actinomycetota bacterium]